MDFAEFTTNGGAHVDQPERPNATIPPTIEQVAAILERIRDGEHGLLPYLRQALDNHAEIWQRIGDLGCHARSTWLNLVAGRDAGLRECLRRKLEADQAAIAGPDPSPLENLLAARIVLTQLQLDHTDALAGQVRETSIRHARFLAERQDRTSRRLLHSIGALIALRRLTPAAPMALDVPPDGGHAAVGQARARPSHQPCLAQGQREQPPEPSRARPAAVS
jgi:hypothetical protein